MKETTIFVAENNRMFGVMDLNQVLFDLKSITKNKENN